MARTTTYTSTDDLARALDGLVPAIEREIQTAAEANAAGIASEAQGRAVGVGGVASLVSVSASGATISVTDRTGGNVWAGAEFGGGSRPATRQFSPYLGTIGGGYFLWPTIRARSQVDLEASADALVKAMDSI